MAVVALSIEPYAASRSFPGDLAHALKLELVDLRAVEIEIANMTAEGPDAVVDLVHSADRHWRICASDLATRLSELILETTLRGNALIVGWSGTVVLRSLPHVATISLRGSVTQRAVVLQRRKLYTHFDSALLDLASEDLSVDRLVARFLQERRSCVDLAELTLDTERVSEQMCIDLIKCLISDIRCAHSSKARQMVESRLVALNSNKAGLPR
jgi:hypothetical protein